MNPLKRISALIDKNVLIDAGLIILIAFMVFIYKINKM
jgi:hypothetical protein